MSLVRRQLWRRSFVARFAVALAACGGDSDDTRSSSDAAIDSPYPDSPRVDAGPGGAGGWTDTIGGGMGGAGMGGAGTGGNGTGTTDGGAAVDTGPSLHCGAGAITSPSIAGPPSTQTDGDQTFRSLAVDPTNPDVVFVGSEGNGIFRSVDGGKTWTWPRSGLRYEGFNAYAETWDIAVVPSRPTRVYAAMTDSPGPTAGPYPSSRAGIYRSDDGGTSWRQVGCTLPGSKAAVLMPDATDPDKLIVGFDGGKPSFTNPPSAFYPGGFWRTNDGGSTWTPIGAPTNAESNGYWRLRRRGTAVYTFGIPGREPPMVGVGLLRSPDGVAPFVPMPVSFAGMTIDGWDVSNDGQTLLVQPRDSQSLKRSTDGGHTYANVTFEFGIFPNGVVVMLEGDPSRVLFGGGNAIYRTTDGFATVTRVLETDTFVEDIEPSASNPQVIYASARGLVVYRSEDGGASWKRVARLRQDVVE